jgi:hypothetical protein
VEAVNHVIDGGTKVAKVGPVLGSVSSIAQKEHLRVLAHLPANLCVNPKVRYLSHLWVRRRRRDKDMAAWVPGIGLIGGSVLAVLATLAAGGIATNTITVVRQVPVVSAAASQRTPRLTVRQVY